MAHDPTPTSPLVARAEALRARYSQKAGGAVRPADTEDLPVRRLLVDLLELVGSAGTARPGETARPPRRLLIAGVGVAAELDVDVNLDVHVELVELDGRPAAPGPRGQRGAGDPRVRATVGAGRDFDLVVLHHVPRPWFEDPTASRVGALARIGGILAVTPPPGLDPGPVGLVTLQLGAVRLVGVPVEPSGTDRGRAGTFVGVRTH